MYPGIRGKFIAIVVVAAVLPLLVGLFSIRRIGRSYYIAQQGDLFKLLAQDTAGRLDQILNNYISDLGAWITFSGAASQIERLLPRQKPPSFARTPAEIEALDRRWPKLGTDTPELQPILNNEIARQLHAFQTTFPLFAEVFVTDAKGRLIASTNKTTDYWQSDETWWQEARLLSPREAWVEGIHFEESARVYSLDVALPIRDDTQPGHPTVGVIKGVINISPLFASLRSLFAGPHPHCHVVMGDRRILVGLFGAPIAPLPEKIPEEAARRIERAGSNWIIDILGPSEPELIGFAPLDLSDTPASKTAISGLSMMYILVHDDLATVLTPVRRQLWILTLVGGGGILVFIALALLIAHRKIIAPLRVLHAAALGIAEQAHLKLAAQGDGHGRAPLQPRQIDALIEKVERVDTGDEIGSLAQGFAMMARRVINYHEQLEREIVYRTEEIEMDLKLAREFQEAFLPKMYPEVPSPSASDPIALSFYHVYKPAQSVSGDFFDVHKLSDHRAGIFIADVMGHGARSALITAILRTLLQDLAGRADNPGQLLSLLNRHFYKITPHDETLVFATAFYLVVDTRERAAKFASAGHPAPLLIDRSSGRVTPLFQQNSHHPALGLLPDTRYEQYHRTVRADEIILLYTDGVTDALNPRDEEFGLDRLTDVVRANMGEDAPAINQSILESLHAFMDTVPSPDDICLVSVQITPPHHS